MMSFTLSPSCAMASCMHNKNTRANKRRVGSNHWTFYVYFATALCSVLLALSHHSQQPGGDTSTAISIAPSLFPGTATVSAAVATTLRSSPGARPTMMALTTGSSRTLIELGRDTSCTATATASGVDADPARNSNVNSNINSNCLYELDASYIDGDYEQGLIILRLQRSVTVNDNHHSRPSPASSTIHHAAAKEIHNDAGLVPAILQRARNAARNPIVVLVVAGNIASMVGILPPGISGFLPAVGVVLGGGRRYTGSKAATSLASAVFKRCRSFLSQRGRVQLAAGRAVLSKLRVKLTKLVSSLYKNRSRYSLLSDCAWYVPGNQNGETMVTTAATTTTTGA
eukprot:jgi/Psemu1/22645/gm1.22645_g